MVAGSMPVRSWKRPSPSLPRPELRVADTVGAGDSFTAGFVSALLAGRSHLEAVALATRVAAFVCSHHGAMPTLPSEYRVVEA